MSSRGYIRLSGGLFHRERIIGLTPAQTFFRKRPYLIVEDIGATAFPIYLFGVVPIFHFQRPILSNTHRIYFPTADERDACLHALRSVCPNLADTSTDELRAMHAAAHSWHRPGPSPEEEL